MPVLQRNSYIAVKTETTLGTENAPGATDAIVCYEADLQPMNDSTSTERNPIAGHMATQTPVPGLTGGSFKCKTYLVGSGIAPSTAATAPPFAPLMIACGWKQTVVASTSVTFAPASYANPDAWSSTASFAGWDTVSIREYSKTTATGSTGHIYKMKGCVGTSKITGNIGEPVTVDFDMKGCYLVPIDDQSITSPTFTNSSVTPVPLLSATATWTPSGGSAFTGVIRSFEIDLGCETVYRTDANDSSGRISALITNRKPTWTVKIEDPDDYDAGATGQDFWTAFTAGTKGAWNFGPIGSTAGNIFEIDIPVAGILSVSTSFEDGIRVMEIKGACANSNMSTGDDEITVKFT